MYVRQKKKMKGGLNMSICKEKCTQIQSQMEEMGWGCAKPAIQVKMLAILPWKLDVKRYLQLRWRNGCFHDFSLHLFVCFFLKVVSAFHLKYPIIRAN